jgi:hypothetical protein
MGLIAAVGCLVPQLLRSRIDETRLRLNIFIRCASFIRLGRA